MPKIHIVLIAVLSNVQSEVYNIGFAIEITQRLRERIVPDTPEDYEKIYIDCWDNEPDNRPAMIKVVYELYAIITKTNINYHNQMNNEESKFQLSVQQLHLNAANPFSGISKSSNELTDNNDNNGDKIYGIIPYMAPEVFHGQDYTTASDIYSLGMIMWELMTGRRPFWDHDHDTHLIIRICDNIRPPIVTNAPEGYIELMEKCWHSDPNKRPTANYLKEVVDNYLTKELEIDINANTVNINESNEEYLSREIDIDINLNVKEI
ncbi:11831_t:CDS:2 [Funneliformis geosporum]|uniref:11831_t:CDS:1 n=1 Tax=Funneliformis geosporum TaxID=1117311 RepID=A0A9W4SSK6_9GLOM|nr:11831_t:CDS:2 [Funneliformis geosporum]